MKFQDRQWAAPRLQQVAAVGASGSSTPGAISGSGAAAVSPAREDGRMHTFAVCTALQLTCTAVQMHLAWVQSEAKTHAFGIAPECCQGN